MRRISIITGSIKTVAIKTALIKPVLAISVISALFPQLAFASAPSFSCSSNLVVSLDNGYQASCDGDFSFTDGVLQNDTSIKLTATGFLSVGEHAKLSAPIINLISNDIFLRGTLDAPNGIVTLNSTDSTVLANTAQINVAKVNVAGQASLNKQVSLNNQVAIQSKPQLIVNWEQFQLTPGGNIQFASYANASGIVIDRIGGAITLGPNSGISITQANGGDKSSLIVTQVPEPSTYAMMILGLASIGLSRKRK